MTSHVRHPFLLILTTLAVVLGLALAQDAADDAASAETPDEAFDQALSTASYGLFGIDGGAHVAQLQVTGMAEGGSRLVLSLVGDEPPEAELRAALYEGDCGPDRPLVLELAPVGIGGDPFVSTTDTDLSFEAVTGGDHFAYLFQGEAIDRPDTFGLDGDAVACGEVGAGANR